MLNHLAWLQSNTIVTASLVEKSQHDHVVIHTGQNLKGLCYSNGYVYFLDGSILYRALLDNFKPEKILENVHSFYVHGSIIIYILYHEFHKLYSHNIYESPSYTDISSINISQNDSVKLYHKSKNVYICKNSTLYAQDQDNGVIYMELSVNGDINSIFSYSSSILCICTSITVYYGKANSYKTLAIPNTESVICYNENFYFNNIHNSCMTIFGILRAHQDYVCFTFKNREFSYFPKVHFNNGKVTLSLDSKEMQYIIKDNKLIRSDNFNEVEHTQSYIVNLYIHDDFHTIVQNIHISLCDI